MLGNFLARRCHFILSFKAVPFVRTRSVPIKHTPSSSLTPFSPECSRFSDTPAWELLILCNQVLLPPGGSLVVESAELWSKASIVPPQKRGVLKRKYLHADQHDKSRAHRAAGKLPRLGENPQMSFI
ncbi:unnamed protein product [Sphacelaria rigidula]